MTALQQNGARHTAGATTSATALLFRFIRRAKWRHFVNAPSNLGWMILRRKYDAFTTDAAYSERPSSWLGPLGWWADRRVRNYPLHVALRERLEIVSSALATECGSRLGMGAAVTVLSAPAGLCRDLVQAGTRVREALPGAPDRLRLYCVDIDERGDVIVEARHRIEAAGLDAIFLREDIFASAELSAACAAGLRFDVVNCIGLACWLTLDDLGTLLRTFRARMNDGGLLLIDNFAWHPHSALGDDLEIDTKYHGRDEFLRGLREAGFDVVAEQTTANGVNTVFQARAR